MFWTVVVESLEVLLHGEIRTKGRNAMPQFQNDSVSRALVRVLLILQLSALVIVLVFSLLGLSLLAVVISLLTFLVLIGVILWLYIRYQTLPIVRQKKELEKLVLKFQKNLRGEAHTIQRSKK